MSTRSMYTCGTVLYLLISRGRKLPTPIDGSKICNSEYSFASGSSLMIE